MPELIFNAEDHTYTLDGKRLPSVTEILRPLSTFDRVPADVLDRAREFGSDVHLACELDDKGCLDHDGLDPALQPYLRGWQRFKAESGFVLTAIETPVYSKRYGYAGTPDRRCTVRGADGLLDIKTGAVPISVGPQTAGYAIAITEMEATGRLNRYCVSLAPDEYRLIPLKDPRDFNLFLSCKNIHDWRNNG